MADVRRAGSPAVLVFQPDINRILERESKDALASWEKRISEWAGVPFSSDEVISSGGTCTDSGNDCDVD